MSALTAFALSGDFDGDGRVGFSDFFLFTDQFGQPVNSSNSVFDLDGDSTIDVDDFFIFSDHFGLTNEWIPVPLRSAEQAAAGIAGGEGMQLIYGISYAPSNQETVYLVTDVSQVWKSVDGGSTWQMRNNGFLANGGLSSSPPDLLSRPVAGRTAGCALNGPLRPRIDPDTGRQATQRYCELGRRTGKRSSGSCRTLAVPSAPGPRVQKGASFYLYFMEAGDVLFMGAAQTHGAYPWMNEKPRRGVILTYISKNLDLMFQR